MADEVGLAQLNMTALATRLGVKQPSLYKHIDSMASLRRGIAIQAERQLGEVLAKAAVGRSGGDAILSMAHASRRWALVHPACYDASISAPAPGDVEHDTVSLSVIQVIADVLAAYQLDGDDAIDAIRAFRASVHGFVALETQGAFALSADPERSFDRLMRGFIIALANWNQLASPSTIGADEADE